MFSVENFTELRELSVFFIILDEKELSLFISEHCFAKKELKMSRVYFHEIVMGYMVIFYYSKIFLRQTSRF